MSFKPKAKQENTYTNTNGFTKSADGFMNIKLTDKNGNVHSLSKGAALSLKNQLERSIINVATQYKKDTGEDLVFSLSGTVHVNMTEEDHAKDIELF